MENNSGQPSNPEGIQILLNLLKTVPLHSHQKAYDLIDKQLQSIGEENPKEKAILLGGKALICIVQRSLSDAEGCTDEALRLARLVMDIEADPTAEAWALLMKGLINEIKEEHKKAQAFYTKSLDMCPGLLKPGVLLAFVPSFSHEGDYSQALHYINEVIELTETLIKGKTAIEESLILRCIQAEAWSLSGTVNESLGDFTQAQKDYDCALELARECNFLFEIYLTLLRKAGLMLKMEKKSDAKACIDEVERMLVGEIDARAPLYIAHERAKYFRADHRYDETLAEYRRIIYGATENERERDVHLKNLMEYEVSMFKEILYGICECLYGLGGIKVRFAEDLRIISGEYEKVISKAGVHIEKNVELWILRKKIADKLWQVFEREPYLILYKHIRIKYNPVNHETTYSFIGEDREYDLDTRSFLIFKYLYDNIDKCIPISELVRIWQEHGVPLKEFADVETMIHVYKGRLMEKLHLDGLLITCPKPEGYKLLP